MEAHREICGKVSAGCWQRLAAGVCRSQLQHLVQAWRQVLVSEPPPSRYAFLLDKSRKRTSRWKG